MLFDLTKENIDQFINKDSGYVLVEFYAPWCKSCSALLSILEDISDDYYGKMKVFKINADNEPDLADRFDVMSLPTMILFKDGEVKDELTGLHSHNQITGWLNI